MEENTKLAGQMDESPDTVASVPVSRRTFVGWTLGIGAAAVLCQSWPAGLSFADEAAAEGAVLDGVPSDSPLCVSQADNVCAMGAHNPNLDAAYGLYPVFDGKEADEYGLVYLTAAAAGKQLKSGVSYRVKENVTLSPGGCLAGLVPNNNLIYIDKGCTLTVRGGNAETPTTVCPDATPGQPGIELSGDKSLCVLGQGTLVATGGNAGNGQAGLPGGDAFGAKKANAYQGGTGGAGGRGGGGAGAGIGTMGSMGGAGAPAVIGPRRAQEAKGKNEVNGNDGAAGSHAAQAAEPGFLCLAGKVTVTAQGGQEGSGGQGGGHGKNDETWYAKPFGRRYHAGYGGGGGGGGAGSAANGFGCGGTGGTGGSSGGSGGLCYKTVGAPGYPTPEGGYGGNRGGTGGEHPVAERTVNGRLEGHGLRGAGDRKNGEGKYGGVAHAADSKGSPSPAWPSKENKKLRRLLDTEDPQYPAIDGKCWADADIAEFAVPVGSIEDFSDIKSSNGWLIKNNIANRAGDGQTDADFYTLASVTPASDVQDQLKKYIPGKRDGYTFTGWKLLDEDLGNPVVYNATKDEFDFSKLNEKCFIGKTGSAFATKWMHPAAVTFSAEWESASTGYSVKYVANGSTFADPSTKKAAGVSEYTESDGVIGASKTLWKGETPYLVQPPAGKDPDEYELKWCKDAAGDGALMDAGSKVSASKLGASTGQTVTLYAIWDHTDE